VFPPWRLAGVPLRMMVMVQLAAAVLAAAGWSAMQLKTTRSRVLGAALLALIAIEYWPYPLPLTQPAVPSYVSALKSLPPGAVLDLASNGPQALYYQTVHEHPIAFGYISRTPTSVDKADVALTQQILSGSWDTATQQHGFRYVIKRDRAAEIMMRGLDHAPLPPIDARREVFRDGDVAIYRF
jgi:hypothetical protein